MDTEQEKQQLEELANQFREKQVYSIKKLSKFIDDVWIDNQAANKDVRLQMVHVLRRVKGDYDPIKLAAIKAFRGSEAYVRNGENKCRSASSWIKDIYRGSDDLPWDLEPTAVPEIPQNIQMEIRDEIQRQGQMYIENAFMQAQQSGMPVDQKAIAKMMNEWQKEAEEKAIEEIQKEAKEKCKKATLTIRDNNQEGGWNEAFKDFIWYFVRLKCGIIKGPTLVKKNKQQWEYDEATGMFNYVTREQLVNDVYAVSPFMFYPSKGMSKISDGNTIEVRELTNQNLADLIGVPGYSEEEIRIVLDKLAKGELKARWFTIEDETMVKQVEKEKTYQTHPSTANVDFKKEQTIYAQEFWGTVSGKLLIEWGIASNLDPNMQYQTNCWKIGDHVIKAVINPDSLGRKPYHITSWAKNPNWIWGEGLLEFAGVIEDILNAIVRALVNNIGIASGPQVEVNIDRCDDKTPLYPWKRWDSTTMQMKDGAAVSFWQPEMHVGELIQAYQFFSQVLDNMTVPSYTQGAAQQGVTAGTATVFTQLLAAAARSIKDVVANIDDDIITPYIQMCYDFLMRTSEDVSLKGDAKCVAKGVNGLLAKEQEAQRKVEFLQIVANPVFSQILGEQNLGAVLAQVAKSQNIQLPDMDRLEGSSEISQIIQKMLMGQAGVDNTTSPNQQTGQVGAGGTPTNAQATTADGRPAGSPEFQQ